MIYNEHYLFLFVMFFFVNLISRRLAFLSASKALVSSSTIVRVEKIRHPRVCKLLYDTAIYRRRQRHVRECFLPPDFNSSRDGAAHIVIAANYGRR